MSVNKNLVVVQGTCSRAHVPGHMLPGHMFRGTCSGAHAPGHMLRGTCSGAHVPGHMFRGTCSGAHVPGTCSQAHAPGHMFRAHECRSTLLCLFPAVYCHLVIPYLLEPNNVPKEVLIFSYNYLLNLCK